MISASRLRFWTLGAACALAWAAPAFAAVEANFVGNSLNVRVTAPDSLVLTLEGGIVKFNGVDPPTGPVTAAFIGAATFNWESAGQSHDVSVINETDFPFLFNAIHYIGAGGQTITGGNRTQTYSVNAPDTVIIGGSGSDFLEIVENSVGTSFSSTGGFDRARFLGNAGADMVRLEDGPGGSVAMSRGANVLLTATGLGAVEVELGPGDDSLTIPSGSTFELSNVRVDPGEGSDTLDVAGSMTNIIYDRYLGPGDDTIHAPTGMDVDLFLQLQIYDATNSVTFTQSNGASAQRVAMTGDNVGTVTYDRASTLLIYAGGGSDTFNFQSPDGFGLSRISLFGNSGNDSANLAMSSGVEIAFDGGDHTSGDSAIIDRNGYDAVQMGDTVTAPGAQSITLTDVENVTLQGTVFVSALPILLGIQAPTLAADHNVDGIVDAADLII